MFCCPLVKYVELILKILKMFSKATHTLIKNLKKCTERVCRTYIFGVPACLKKSLLIPHT